MRWPIVIPTLSALAILSGCSGGPAKESTGAAGQAPAPAYFKPDQATAGVLTGTVSFEGKRPARKTIDMSGDPACSEGRHGKVYDESFVANGKGRLANAFVYIKSGLGDKKFEPPAKPVTIDQHGCSFQPRVMGIQTGQTLQVTNSDPVTHNIHPLAEVNREWNHSQGQGDPPLARRFLKPEIMIRVKCNIHSWMRAFIGVVEHPYFAVTHGDGNFEIRNIPPGDYVIQAWHETAGTQEQKITVTPAGKIETSFTLKGE